MRREGGREKGGREGGREGEGREEGGRRREEGGRRERGREGGGRREGGGWKTIYCSACPYLAVCRYILCIYLPYVRNPESTQKILRTD